MQHEIPNTIIQSKIKTIRRMMLTFIFISCISIIVGIVNSDMFFICSDIAVVLFLIAIYKLKKLTNAQNLFTNLFLAFALSWFAALIGEGIVALILTSMRNTNLTEFQQLCSVWAVASCIVWVYLGVNFVFMNRFYMEIGRVTKREEFVRFYRYYIIGFATIPFVIGIIIIGYAVILFVLGWYRFHEIQENKLSRQFSHIDS